MKDFKPNFTVYLANAYSSKLVDKDQARLEQEQRALLEAYIGGAIKKKYGCTVILPIAISAAMARLCHFGTGFDSWANDDYTFISKSDEVWVLLAKGWDKSQGVIAEIKFAKEMGITVKYLNQNTLELYDGHDNGDIISEYLNDYKI